MPITLHPHLKRGLVVEHDEPSPEDLLEDLSSESTEAEEQTRKRQRIERIAASYLKGKPPLILSAGLRGPFNNGWKNPWAKSVKSDGTRRKSRSTIIQDSQQAKKGTKCGGRSRAAEHTQTGTVTQSITSPEASRAAHHDLESYNQTCTLDDDNNNIPLTAPSPAPQTQPHSIKLSSAGSEQEVQGTLSLTNPFWLRRPQSSKTSDRQCLLDPSSDASPIRLRDGASSLDRASVLHLVQPRAPIGTRAKTIEDAPSMDLTITSSAPMVVSSPVAPPTASSVGKIAPLGSESTAQIDDLTTQTPSAPNTGRQAAQLVETLDTDVGNTASQVSNTSKDSSQKKARPTKWTFQNAPRSKPRAVNFNSSPIIRSVKNPAKEVESLDEHGSPQRRSQDSTQPTPSDYASSKDASAPGDDHNSLAATTRRESQYSTQAAMLLAQIEFHESTFSTSSHMSRPWSEAADITPRRLLPEPSPGITPFSNFRPQLTSTKAPESVFRDPAMSTQDLFAAASPFALSTIKKKPDILVPNSIRMTATSRKNRSMTTDKLTPHSATRNTKQDSSDDGNDTPWSHVPRKATSNDVELPQLDFHTSLDDYGQLDSFNLADRVLRNLNET